MTKEVLISISGLHMGMDDVENKVESEDDEAIEVLSAGNYYFKNGKHYLFFEEVIEGFREVTKTQIKWQEDQILEVRKTGLSNMNMIFEKNKKHHCFYQTPFGQLNLGICTTDIRVEETEENIDICAEYVMDVNYEPFAECAIKINVKPRESKAFKII